MVGQEQDMLGGQFSQAESFIGKVTNLDIWDRVLEPNEIIHLFQTCNTYYGNILFWGEFRNYMQGDVQIEPSPFCGDCPQPTPILNGVIKVDDKIAVYSCRKGFKLILNMTSYENFSRKCGKTAEWEGNNSTPYCKSILRGEVAGPVHKRRKKY